MFYTTQKKWCTQEKSLWSFDAKTAKGHWGSTIRIFIKRLCSLNRLKMTTVLSPNEDKGSICFREIARRGKLFFLLHLKKLKCNF
ncbi:hypothetical protein HHI36_022799 [Cryptolaemus montrouzieri]|uniref:Uncharacterized protein n=1 Tax=Cryptolaemus montrouzieri TaxID=559131 RepID=A0ABD2PEF1_9CUCU